MGREFEAKNPNFDESEYEVFLLTFSHAGSNFGIWAAPICDYYGIAVPGRRGGIPTRYGIIDEQHILLGEIYAEVIGMEVVSDELINQRIGHGRNHTVFKEPGHVGGLVREGIVQLLVSGIVSRWTSSDLLLPGGTLTYEALLRDPRLTGTKIPLGIIDPSSKLPKYRYSLEAKR